MWNSISFYRISICIMIIFNTKTLISADENGLVKSITSLGKQIEFMNSELEGLLRSNNFLNMYFLDNCPEDLNASRNFKCAPLANKKCYCFGEFWVDWVEAFMTCQNIGMRLLSLESQEEENLLTNFIFNNTYGISSKSHYWTSGQDFHEEGQWIWQSNGKKIQNPIKWKPGEPTNSGVDGKSEDCLVWRFDVPDNGKNGLFDDWPCYSKTTNSVPICEKIDLI